MDRFNENGGVSYPVLNVREFSIETRVVEEQRWYAIELRDPDGSKAVAMFDSYGVAHLAASIGKAAVATCDDAWMTALMVMLTESREESVEKLFESGHAKDSL